MAMAEEYTPFIGVRRVTTSGNNLAEMYKTRSKVPQKQSY
jgi:hypothetical protein